MLDKTTYLQLMKDFSDVASWAIWESPLVGAPKSNMRSVSMFDYDNILELLNPNFVFIGLNGSGVHDDYMDTSKPWHNFHSSNPRGHDYKLRYALVDTPYWGSYITDAIKELPEVDSNKVSVYLKNHNDVVVKNMELLRKELEILGTNPVLICLGGKSYEIVKKHLGNQFTVKKIMHYSYQIGKEDYRRSILNVLAKGKARENESKANLPQNASVSNQKSINHVSIDNSSSRELMPSLENYLKLTGLDMPENWVGDNRDRLLLLFEPIIKGTDFHIQKNMTDTTKNGLNLFYKNETRRRMGFGKIKSMSFLVYPTSAFYEEIRHKVRLPETDPKKRQPHMKMTIAEFWDVLYKITR